MIKPGKRRAAEQKPAVVIGAGANGLGAIRSLKEAGVATIVVGGNAAGPALLSRYPIQKLVVDSSQDRDAALLTVLRRIRYERPVLIPTADVSVSFMIRHRALLASRFDFCLPDDSLAETLLDKARESALIASLNIPLPKTIQHLSDHRSCLRERLGLPMIVKPTCWAHTRYLGAKNRIIRRPDELERFLDEYKNVLWAFLAQELIPGSDSNQWVCNCTFGRTHKLIGAFTFRRIRLAPAHRGVTSYAVSESNAQVVSLVARLGRAMRYTGPAMVEFKFDERDGQYKYLELNPRIGLCNYFDTTCKVNNVYYTYCLATGQNIKQNGHRQRDGVMYLSLHGDLYSRIQDGEALATILRHYISNAWRPHVGAYFSWNDLMPAIVMGWRNTWSLFRGACGKLLRP